MRKKRVLVIAFVISLTMMLVGCTKTSPKGDNTSITLNIAYQYGLAYAPIIVAQNQHLIEESYKQSTGNEVSITWNQMNSGADINTGIASGNIQLGFMGVAPAITGIMNNAGYKICTNLSGQEHGLMTIDSDIQTLKDLIDSQKQIALVNFGSIQHIILAKALANQGYNPHALDSNLVSMKHPDGMTSLQSSAVSCHLTTNPYLYQERDDANLHEVPGISDIWSEDNSFIVGVASTKLYEENRELYNAICDAIAQAIEYTNTNIEAVAKITCEYNGNPEETELQYLRKGSYHIETHGVFDLAQFMAEANFIDAAPKSYSELVYDNVKGD